MYPKPFSRSIFLRTKAQWPALASQSEALKLKPPFLLLDNIFYKTLHLRVNIVLTSDGIQNFKNRFSFVSNSVTTSSLILESAFAAVV